MKRIRKLFITAIITALCAQSAYSLEVYREKATASFYGADFHGKRTSNNEKYNMYAYTCANKELPFDTILKVTNLANGKTVQVRVNDRGPFVSGRTVDLSTQAAIDLEMTKAGLAAVKLEIVKRGPDTKLSRDTAASAKKIMANIEAKSSSQKTTSTRATAAGGKNVSGGKTASSGITASSKLADAEVPAGKIWDIQVASFSSKSNATEFAKKLSKEGFKSIVFQTTKAGVIRVVVSKVPGSSLNETRQKLRSLGHTDFIMRERKN